jgi:uncharacterized protein YidB (DUF937 family)
MALAAGDREPYLDPTASHRQETTMGLMDILNGMRNGPGGGTTSAPQQGSGGMSPIMMALLGLLAYKAVKGGGLGGMFGGGQQQQQQQPTQAPQSGGGLGDILGGMFGGNAGGVPGAQPGSGGGGLGGILGGLFGGAAAGSVLSGGLGQVINDLQRTGQGRTAQSWVGTGQNDPIAPDDLGKALGADTISTLSQQTGMPPDDLLQGLSQNLPQFVDQLTPEGRLPTDEETSRW